MDELLRIVKKELDKVGDKGLTSSNLDTTYKLIDIYKDIKEAECYDKKLKGGEDYDSYDARGRDSRGRYTENYNTYDRQGGNGSYNHYPLSERDERYFTRMREGMYDYNEGRQRYRDGNGKERMIDGIEMTMGAITNFVENLIDYAETTQEKEIIRKHLQKLKNV